MGWRGSAREWSVYHKASTLMAALIIPVAVSVHEGNVADSQTLMPEVKRLREDFGIEQLVLVCDRGMIGSKAMTARRALSVIMMVIIPADNKTNRMRSATAPPANRSIERTSSIQREISCPLWA